MCYEKEDEYCINCNIRKTITKKQVKSYDKIHHKKINYDWCNTCNKIHISNLLLFL